MNNLITIFGIILFTGISYSQNTYLNNEDGLFEDILTPQYYISADSASFRYEVNKFVYFVRTVQFQHPLEDSTGQMPQYSIPTIGKFGAGKGSTGTAQHHAAIDLHVGNNETDVTMYAAYDGHLAIYRDAPKYRHYLSITKNIEDSSGNIIGKMVTLYAHIDLDLDSTDNLFLDGQYVNQGDIVSKHLYSGTVGGPHLHFEIRYYRPGDVGDEEFYGFVGSSGNIVFTEPSAGSWSYGYWNSNIGYGFANPENHLQTSTMGIPKRIEEIPGRYELCQNYPNPFNPSTTIFFSIPSREFVNLEVLNTLGQLVATLESNYLIAGSYKYTWQAHNQASGLYFYRLATTDFVQTRKMLLAR